MNATSRFLMLSLLSTCLVATPMISAAADKAAEQEDRVRKSILSKLGENEDGHFLLVLKKTNHVAIVPQSLPANIRRLPSGGWMEIIYQVEMIESREAAVEYLLKFYTHTQQVGRGSRTAFDWRLVAHYDDSAKANTALKKAQQSFAQRSVTLRPKTTIGLTFFRDKPVEPFQPN